MGCDLKWLATLVWHAARGPSAPPPPLLLLFLLLILLLLPAPAPALTAPAPAPKHGWRLVAAGCRSVEGWRLGLVASGMMYGACAIYVCLCAKSIGKEKDLEEEVRHVLHACVLAFLAVFHVFPCWENVTSFEKLESCPFRSIRVWVALSCP